MDNTSNTNVDQVDTVGPAAERHYWPLTTIKLTALHESPFNPRKTFVDAGLEELAASLQQMGMVQPIMVRQMPQIDLDAGQFEIIFGHRRVRAARLAGLTDVPAQVRPFTSDLEAAQLQIAENLQREDVHPIEEAEGFAALIRDHGVTVDQLMKQIGKGRSHVYSRLKLATLSLEARQACLEGRIGAEVAGLVARVPREQQEKALAIAMAKDWQGNAKPFRDVRQQLLTNFTLDLEDALWALDDAELLPPAGPCTTCPKRSGESPEIYGDIVATDRFAKSGPNICTDPGCFAAKKAAKLKRQADELAATGVKVVDGKKAGAALDQWGKVKGNTYVAVAEVKAELKKAGKVTPVATVLLQDPRTGKTVEAVKRADLAAAGAPVVAKPDNYEQRRLREQKERDVAGRKQKRFNDALLRRVRETIVAAPRTAFDLRIAAKAAIAGVGYHDRDVLCELWAVEDRDELETKVEALSPDQLGHLLVDCALVKGSGVYEYGPISDPDCLLSAAAEYGIDVDQVRAESAEPASTPSTAAQALTGGEAAAADATDAFVAAHADEAASTLSKAARAPAKATSRVRYRDPATGSTWSGRGLQPAWIKAALARGARLEDFEQSNKAAVAAPPASGIDLLTQPLFFKKKSARRPTAAAKVDEVVATTSTPAATLSPAAAWPFPKHPGAAA